MGTAQWDVECNTGRNIPSMKQTVPEEDEVLKQIDGLIENKNSSLSDWICSNGIKNYTSHEIFLRTFLSCRKVRRSKLIVDKMVRSCVGRGLSLLDRTITKKKYTKWVKQYCTLFSDERKTWWGGAPRIWKDGWLGIRPILLAKNDKMDWTEVSELWEVYEAELQSREGSQANAGSNSCSRTALVHLDSVPVISLSENQKLSPIRQSNHNTMTRKEASPLWNDFVSHYSFC